jgi:hypothetical protein
MLLTEIFVHTCIIVQYNETLCFSAVPLIAQRPADTHVSAGSNAIFECGVRGNPKPTIFWSLQNNDTVLFPKESWNEFHAEDTKDSVSTLIIYVS